MRIKYIIPFPFDEEGIANRAAQIPRDLLGPDTEVECIAVRNSATLVDCYYEDLVFDMYIAEAGLRAEEEGYDAVIMDTVSDSGMYALRSRLSIPVIGPGLVSYVVAITLGKRFSIVTMWDKWTHLYEKNLASYDLKQKCASIRAVNIPPDVEALFAETLARYRDEREPFVWLARNILDQPWVGRFSIQLHLTAPNLDPRGAGFTLGEIGILQFRLNSL